MLYWFMPSLQQFWGPFRLLGSHLLLLALGAIAAALAVGGLLPRLWTRLP